jgi:NADH dehydrogenase
VGQLGLPLERGRIVVDATMKVDGVDGAWAIGDAAAVPDPAQKRKAPSPPTAQHALRQGKRVAQNVAATIGNGHTRPFTQDPRRVRRPGRFQAVASTLGIRWRGSLVPGPHLPPDGMPGFRRQLRLVTDWSVDLRSRATPPTWPSSGIRRRSRGRVRVPSAGGTSADAQAEPASTIGRTK